MGSRVVDLSLVRAFRLTTSASSRGPPGGVQRLQLVPAYFAGRQSGANNSPVTNLSNANFGRYLASDEPRILQFAVKYQF